MQASSQHRTALASGGFYCLKKMNNFKPNALNNKTGKFEAIITRTMAPEIIPPAMESIEETGRVLDIYSVLLGSENTSYVVFIQRLSFWWESQFSVMLKYLILPLSSKDRL